MREPFEELGDLKALIIQTIKLDFWELYRP